MSLGLSSPEYEDKGTSVGNIKILEHPTQGTNYIKSNQSISYVPDSNDKGAGVFSIKIVMGGTTLLNEHYSIKKWETIINEYINTLRIAITVTKGPSDEITYKTENEGYIGINTTIIEANLPEEKNENTYIKVGFAGMCTNTIKQQISLDSMMEPYLSFDCNLSEKHGMIEGTSFIVKI